MTEEEKTEKTEPTLRAVAEYQTKRIGELLDLNQAMVVVCRRQAENWQELAEGYLRLAQMAGDIAESCAVAARISVDRTGDILSAEFDLVEVYPEEEEEDDDDTE